jgi:hypothetical protein
VPVFVHHVHVKLRSLRHAYLEGVVGAFEEEPHDCIGSQAWGLSEGYGWSGQPHEHEVGYKSHHLQQHQQDSSQAMDALETSATPDQEQSFGKGIMIFVCSSSYKLRTFPKQTLDLEFKNLQCWKSCCLAQDPHKIW